MSVYESGNPIAQQAFQAAVKYVNDNPKEGVKVNQNYEVTMDKGERRRPAGKWLQHNSKLGWKNLLKFLLNNI